MASGKISSSYELTPASLHLQTLTSKPTEFWVTAVAKLQENGQEQTFISIPHRMMIRELIIRAEVQSSSHIGPSTDAELQSDSASCVVQGKTIALFIFVLTWLNSCN